MKRLYELHGEGKSIRQIAQIMEVSRNTVRRYLRRPGDALRRPPRPVRQSKLEPYRVRPPSAAAAPERGDAAV